ncbi:hypothetical protein PYW07_010869 [Mythimna separata]|uniref:Uncharacterized protein n=1 Tax=Mythimna separata TaxID=271217 RepID=A0AAD7Y896_MYTSE|nr:hypothetical protein PYW07_010869 [Mythimna separata]
MRRSMGRRGNNNSGGNGPLMTGHLQDIDLELELLKRKREMIEQQQHLLVMEQQFQTRHSYDQMRYDEPVQHGSNRDFAHLYEPGPKHRAQFGRKRQAEYQWQYDSAPKRTPPKKKSPPQFSVNQHGSGNKNFRPQKPHQGQGFNQGSKFSPRAPAPLMAVKIPKQSIGQKIANQKAPPKTGQKDSTLSKVSKQKAAPAPNKLASLPVAERKSLVAAASKDADMSRMLLPDRVPSQQVSGRLELALGAIMKNIRALITAQPQHASVLRSTHQQRVMKQTVRERIRTVMLGKVVGSLTDILAIYREEFPEETDADVLNIALEAGGIAAPDQNLSTKFIKTEDFGEFFKVNMSTLLETQLNEMFSKLEEIYGSDVPAVNPTEEQTSLENNKEGELEMNKENDLENNKESDLENNKEGEFENNKENDVETNKESELENKEESSENNKDTEQENNQETELQNNKETKQEKKEGDIEVKKEPKAVLDLVKKREEHNKNREFTPEFKDFLNTNIKVYDVKRMIPKLIKRYIPYIVKLMSFDTTYQNTKALIAKKANEQAVKKLGTMMAEQGQGDSASANTTPKKPAAESRQFYNLPYYVKIMGRPSLPKRKVMQTFLAQYNPQSVKKHRTVHNLLFVGFNEKADCDVIVGADGTVIGRNTLSIRICPKASGPKESNGENADVSQDSVNAGGEEQKDGDILSPELDGQITDLLSSIRKSEEEDAAKENGEANENNTGEDQPQVENNAEDVEMKDVGDNENAGDEENNDENVTEENQGDDFTEDVDVPNSASANGTEEPAVTDDSNKEENSQEANEAQKASEKTPTKTEQQSDDKLGELKNVTGRSTPSRTSARLASVTPSSIRTRRASRAAPQN